MEFKIFNYTHPPVDGIYWVVIKKPDHDIDIDDCGKIVGQPNDKYFLDTALVHLETYDDGEVIIMPVDSCNLGSETEAHYITHYSPLEIPNIKEINLPHQ